MKKLFVYLPCYNEELNIGVLIDEWMNESPLLAASGFELVICPIDDCSTDDTKGVIIRKVNEYGPDRIILHEHKQNKNLRGGLNTSINSFLKRASDHDLMCLMDGDATHSPKYIHEMLSKMTLSGKDCIIASRYCKGSNVVGLKRYREFMSDMAKVYYSVMLKVPGVRDYTCGYRLYKRSCIERLVDHFGREPIEEKSFACMMEFLYKLYLTGTTFDEVGFELRYDKKQGDSKMRVFNTMKNSLLSAVRFRKLKRNMRN